MIPHVNLQWLPQAALFHLLLRLFICLQQYLQYPYTLALLLSLCRGVSQHRHSLALLSPLCCWYSVTRITLLTQSKMAASGCQLSLFPSPAPLFLYVLSGKAWKGERETLKNAWPWRQNVTPVSISLLQPVQRALVSSTVWQMNMLIKPSPSICHCR